MNWFFRLLLLSLWIAPSGTSHAQGITDQARTWFITEYGAHSSHSAEQNQAHTSAESHDVAAFVQRLDSLREDANIPGLSVAVVKDHAIVLAAGLGYADIENGIPATTYSRCGAMTGHLDDEYLDKWASQLNVADLLDRAREK